MSQTLPSQLFSIKWRSLLGSAGGHTIESAIAEITDNAFDAEANNITIFVNTAKNCFAILDDGNGFSNITHALGSGTGLTVKTKGKIGNKNTGMFACIAHFNSKKTLILSRYKNQANDESIPIHQQLVLYPELITEICNRPNINMDAADKIIMEGANRKIHIDASTGDRDNFIPVDVNQVRDLFDQNQQIVDFLTVQGRHGTLICYEFSQGSEIFSAFSSTITNILNKMELVTYNTSKYLRSIVPKSISYVNITNPEKNQLLNNESCKKGFLLGKDVIIDTDSEEEWVNDEDNDFFSNLRDDGVISIVNHIYKDPLSSHLYNILKITNLDKMYRINEDGLKQELPNNHVSPSNSIAQIYISFSVISKAEGDKQADIMGKKVDELRRIAFYYGGRFLNFGDFIGWPQERSLKNVRIAFEISYEAIDLVNIQSMKSRIDLNGAHPVIKNTISKIICPMVTKFLGTSFGSDDGIKDWSLPVNENIIKQALGIPVPKPITPNPNPNPATNSVITLTVTPLQTQTQTQTTPPPISPLPPVHRNETTFFPSLNKVQTKATLQTIKKRIEKGDIVGPKSKGDKSKLFSLLNTIMKDIVFEDDLWDEYIDSVMELIDSSSAKNTTTIKDANKLQEYL
jgi:hypothetical protein